MLSLSRSFLVASHVKNCVSYSSHVKRRWKPRKRVENQHPPKNRANYNYLFGRNPGVDGQLEAMNLTEKDLADPDILDNLETQFWNADKVMDDVEREEHINNELLGIYQVTRKHFKEKKYPNMLFWDEKQEIKTLYAQDPEKWTIMRLAFSYPASPAVIKKVIKADWKLRTQEDIEKHDERVKKNWEAFKNGTLDMPNESLKKHLQTFSNRGKMASNFSSMKEVDVSRKSRKQEYNGTKDILKDGGVFGEIYKSYKRLQKSDTEDVKDNIVSGNHEGSIEKGLQAISYRPNDGNFVIPSEVQNVEKRTKEPLPLEEMQRRVLQDTSNANLSIDEQKFVQGFLETQKVERNYDLPRDPIGIKANESVERAWAHIKRDEAQRQITPTKAIKIEIVDNLREGGEVGLSQEPQKDAMKNAHKFVDMSRLSDAHRKQDKEILASFRTAKAARTDLDNETLTAAVKEYVSSHSSDGYPLQIVIPKELWKEGALYRVKDRFYTDDGEFLYRVPGLVKD
ncbi:Neugrin [Frankliniella fusca]|uniref:Neugrin n=1 Tax=Frankliniella fusca TaxID=407009 RepID=A0AAE1HV29_9NEOP|nr:Neugrin [Frankliniella fusca]